MPGMMGRFTTIFKSKMNSAMDKAEDPNQIIDYSYEKQLEMLQKVRRGIADIATSKARLQNQITGLNTQVSQLDSQAQQALNLGREDLARTALTRKAALATQLQTLTGQASGLEAQQTKLMEGESRLQAKIEAFRTQKETMKAQYSAAQASVHINEAATGLSEEMGDVQLAMERAQNRVEGMQARATALDELADTPFAQVGPGGANSDLDRQLAQLSAGADVEAQLAAMKGNLLPGGGTGAAGSIAAPAEGSQEPVPTRYDQASGTHIAQE